MKGEIDSKAVYAFGGCTMDVSRREVTLNGARQAVAPLVFNLLVFLMARRQRVVSKAELLDGVWGGADVSENAMTRAVLNARAAIGDIARPATIIRTVHRVGYRFTPPDVCSEAIVATPSSFVCMRLAVMPIENVTGDGALAWVETGLTTMLVQALAADARLSLIGPEDMQAARSVLGDGVSVDEPALLRLTGAAVLLRARLRLVGERLRLDWRLFGQTPREGRLLGDEPTDMGRRLGDAVESALFSSQRLPVPFVSTDALANQAFARAVHEGEREQWDAAARLLRVVLDIEPRSSSAQLQLLRTLANLYDPQADTVGAALIESALRAGDGRLLAAAHEAMGMALFNIGGAEAQQRGQRHLDAALELAEPFADEEWVTRIHFGQAISAHFAQDAVRARHHYEKARRLNVAHGSPLREATILNNLADLEAADAQPHLARDLAEQALSIARRHGLVGNIVYALGVLVSVEAGFGLFSRAARLCDEMLERAAGLSAIEAELTAWARVVALDLRVHAGGSSMQHPWEQVDTPDTEPRIVALYAMARGHSALAEGHAAQACSSMQDAAMRMASLGNRQAEEEFLAAALFAAERGGPATNRMLQALCVRVEARPTGPVGCALKGALGHAVAALLHAKGDTAAALEKLEEHASSLAPGRAHGLSCIDAAWLHLEAGRFEPAIRWLRSAGPWAVEHPAGRRAAAAAAETRRGECPRALDSLLTSHQVVRS